jgi:hypothetical protein
MDLEECIGRVRVLQEQEKLHITSKLGALREKELLIAQLEEHNYHLRYNIRMRDIIVEFLQKWQARNEPGKHVERLITDKYLTLLFIFRCRAHVSLNRALVGYCLVYDTLTLTLYCLRHF